MMNAASNSTIDLISDVSENSDSDTNSDEIPDYYQPITTTEENGETDESNPNIVNGFHHHQYDAINQQSNLTNGIDNSGSVENGVRSLDLSDDEDERKHEEDEMMRRAEMDRAMRRAFEEDENRRNAPLSSENATRVMEAMRGVSFAGSAPDWVRHVPEDNWVFQLQRLRQPRNSPV